MACGFREDKTEEFRRIEGGEENGEGWRANLSRNSRWGSVMMLPVVPQLALPLEVLL